MALPSAEADVALPSPLRVCLCIPSARGNGGQNIVGVRSRQELLHPPSWAPIHPPAFPVPLDGAAGGSPAPGGSPLWRWRADPALPHQSVCSFQKALGSIRSYTTLRCCLATSSCCDGVTVGLDFHLRAFLCLLDELGADLSQQESLSSERCAKALHFHSLHTFCDVGLHA